MKGLRILWVTPKWTLPANDGARVATEKLIANTIKAGAVVDYMCIHQKHEVIDKQQLQEKWGTNKIFTIPRGLPEGGLRKILYYPLFLTNLSCKSNHFFQFLRQNFLGNL